MVGLVALADGIIFVLDLTDPHELTGDTVAHLFDVTLPTLAVLAFLLEHYRQGRK
jgi:hypothetical protein